VRLVLDRLCAACKIPSRSPSGSWLVWCLVTLVARPLTSTSDLRLDHLEYDLVTGAAVRTTREWYWHKFQLRESFIVLSVIQAIEDVLDDYASEHPDEPTDSSCATRRLLQYGLLVVRDGSFAVSDDRDLPVLNPAPQARSSRNHLLQVTQVESPYETHSNML
jgi:hypothetical protein